MADPITREQVERAIARIRADHDQNGVEVAECIGGMRGKPHWPTYVYDAWENAPCWAPIIEALTRWRDELAAAEPVRRVARWDAESQRYALTPPYESREYDFPMSVAHVAGEQQARAWGYEIEGGPEPTPAEDSPERLRERRERLGLSMSAAASLARINMDDVDALEGTCRRWPDCDRCGEMRPAYAAALSAEEARLARDEPERPSPRFKAGDWVRDRDTVFRVAEMHWDDDRWYARPVAGVRDGIAEYSLQPASPPAPEVVDVPQPVVVVKRCGDTSAMWHEHDNHVDVDREGVNVPTPVALILAMADAIRAQQGGAS